VLGPDQNVYVADFDNNMIRVVDLQGNATTLIAQPGIFMRPFGLAFVGSTLYVGTDNDCNGHHDTDPTTQMSGAIWRVDVGAKTATCVIDNVGRPRGLAPLADGRLAVSDYAHHLVRIFDPSSRTFTPLAGVADARGFSDGAGDVARFDEPYAIVRIGAKLVICDRGNHRVRTIGLDGTVTTIAGGEQGYVDGAMAGAKLFHPQGLAAAANGDLFVTDQDNYRVRRIPADASSIETIAGNDFSGYADSEDPAEARFFGLEGLAVTADGKSVVVADGTRGENVPYNRVRIIKR